MSECAQELERITNETGIQGAVLMATYRNLRGIEGIDREQALDIIRSIAADAVQYMQQKV